ncbi:MAG: pitrilysin family protein [Bryobacterales bacterium]
MRILLLLALSALSLYGQKVEAVVHTLDNGMKFLFVPREGDPNVAAGWVAKVGSVNERPGVTGVAHLFEHMMFKGTRTIGTTDIDKDLAIMAELDKVRAEIRAEEEKLIEDQRRGRIADANDPAARSERHKALLEQFSQLIAQQRDLIVKDEFDRIYTGAGASGMNAFTTNDMTMYFINVPSNKLELWFWMESDRLLNPVFREFYSERDVVNEERRLRVDSTPTGKLEEEFTAMFWESAPYSWPVIGWPSDLAGLTRQEALDFFDIYYAPNNITASLVGDFDVEEAKALAEKYFGRIPRGKVAPPPVRTVEVEQLAEKRMIAEAETRPMARIRYHTVPDAHADEPPLLVLAGVLNGRTGRLYKSLVLEQQLAVQAGAGVNGLKWDGFFEFIGVARPPHQPEEIEKALYKEIQVLKDTLVDDHEIQKVKNQQMAEDFERLESKFNLMTQLLSYDALGEWDNINKFSDRIQAVTAEDLRRVARKYFTTENSNVLLYYTSGQRPDGTEKPASEGDQQ